MPVHIGMIVSSLIFLSGFFLLVLKQVGGLGFVLSVLLTLRFFSFVGQKHYGLWYWLRKMTVGNFDSFILFLYYSKSDLCH